MEISIRALGAGAQDQRSGGAARGAGAGYRCSRRAICPLDGITWGKVRVLVAMATAEPFGVPRRAATRPGSGRAGGPDHGPMSVGAHGRCASVVGCPSLWTIAPRRTNTM